jgi:hypothetical protein
VASKAGNFEQWTEASKMLWRPMVKKMLARGAPSVLFFMEDSFSSLSVEAVLPFVYFY